MARISVVTVSMNRTDHLVASCEALSSLDFHAEHIVVDFGSDPPIERCRLPADERIKLFRVLNPDHSWWLTHSYNLGFSLATCDYVLKLDADVLIGQSFVDLLFGSNRQYDCHLFCNRLTLQDWGLPSDMFSTNGLFLCSRSALSAIGGFNPYLRGWGWDEIDLYSRFFLAGFSIGRLPDSGVKAIEHHDAMRVTPLPNLQPLGGKLFSSILLAPSDSTRMEVQNECNRRVALASVIHAVTWPSFEQYLNQFDRSSSLPILSNACLFGSPEKASLAFDLVRLLLKPKRMTHRFWRLLSILGFGPYSMKASSAVLRTCGIDLSLVS